MAAKKAKVKFSDDEEEKIIDFVKSNEVLFNVKHGKFRDAEAKNRLWLTLANELNKDGMYLYVYCFYIVEFISMLISS